ncbi:MAG: Class I SAM-dependent methyltransferase [Nitrospira sp.]|nr:MAG: Class I SAM-dependent methyltransferase [Nitrospira sp.]
MSSLTRLVSRETDFFVTIGHPELVAAMTAEIAVSGPMPFVRFMELALYHPQFGYYMRPPESGAERIGWSGDFYTSSDVHPILGQALAKQARQLDTHLGHPDPFTVVEMGPGKGLLAKHFLSACRVNADDSFSRRLRYVLIERSPAMRELQRQNLLHGLCEPGRITWLEGLDSLAEASVTGLLFSNELPDAFPVHRIQIERGEAQEICVDYDGAKFVECLRPLSSPDIQQYLTDLKMALPEGYQTEINTAAVRWMDQVARAVDRGLAITIDYGHTAQDLYGPDRAKGTLLCYYSQMTSENPYERVGLQDMTSHVDFSTLATVGDARGLHVTGFTNQMSFLMGLGLEDALSKMDPESAEFRAAIHLVRPEGMGRTFKVLIQHKGIEKPTLDGLAFKPFFGSALTLHHAA